ncbi:hypothetical protein WG66_002786 [Moniliophthora roreri]|nr:hypothetical protein WG66_002786 [Moniliophthora roreri]
MTLEGGSVKAQTKEWLMFGFCLSPQAIARFNEIDDFCNSAGVVVSMSSLSADAKQINHVYLLKEVLMKTKTKKHDLTRESIPPYMEVSTLRVALLRKV